MNSVFEIALMNAVLATSLACFVVILTRLWQRPWLVHGLWIVVLLKLFAPPLISIPFRSPILFESRPLNNSAQVIQKDPDTVTARAAETAALELPPGESGNWLVSARRRRSILSLWGLLGVTWICGSITLATLTLYRLFDFRRMLRWTREPSRSLRDVSKRVAKTFGMQSAPRIRLIDGRVSPMVWFFGREPLILVPEELLSRLDEAQTTTLLAHEIAHIRRGDHFVRWLELGAGIVYWWLPVVWWARRRIREAEEECCDGLVAAVFPSYSRAYISSLLQTVDFVLDSPPLPTTVSGFTSTRNLRRRCEMISRRTYQDKNWLGTICLWFVTLGTLPLAMNLSANDALTASESDERTRATNLSHSDLTSRSAKAQRHGEPGFAKRLSAETVLAVGDVKVRLSDLISLKDFERQRRTSDFDSFVAGIKGPVHESGETDDSGAASDGHFKWVYSRPTRAFGQITFNKLKDHPDYFHFEVSQKYHPQAAHRRIVEQLTTLLSDPEAPRMRDRRKEVDWDTWFRTAQVDGRELLLEFRLFDLQRHPKVTFDICIREKVDW